MVDSAAIAVDAVALQERDEFCAAGWMKLIAPAKVNLHLAVGPCRSDGYHEAFSIMHALALHDVIYMRMSSASASCETNRLRVQMMAFGGVEAPIVDVEDNLAVRAVRALAQEVGPSSDGAVAQAIEMRIEKGVPAQGGLGGGSADAAAALLGAAVLWGLDLNDPDVGRIIERTAAGLGADVPFFLHGGCSAYTGVGDEFVRTLVPLQRSIVLVRPPGGVSTADAYRAFDENPVIVPASVSANAASARRADDVLLFNNLAPAAERLMPALADVRTWLSSQLGVDAFLLCGSGAATFAVCDDFASAVRIVGEARKRGWWARATSLSSARAAAIVNGELKQLGWTAGEYIR